MKKCHAIYKIGRILTFQKQSFQYSKKFAVGTRLKHLNPAHAERENYSLRLICILLLLFPIKILYAFSTSTCSVHHILFKTLITSVMYSITLTTNYHPVFCYLYTSDRRILLSIIFSETPNLSNFLRYREVKFHSYTIR